MHTIYKYYLFNLGNKQYIVKKKTVVLYVKETKHNN